MRCAAERVFITQFQAKESNNSIVGIKIPKSKLSGILSDTYWQETVNG